MAKQQERGKSIVLSHKPARVGVLFMSIVVMLAMVGVGSALWSEVMDITGLVQTGDVNVEFSLLDPPTFENDHGKDVADCDAVLSDNLLEVVIGGGYPSYECWVPFDVHNVGSVPVHVYHPQWLDLPPTEAVTFSVVDCYEEDTQLHAGEEIFCTLYIHVEQEASQNDSYVFNGFLEARQFNEPRDAIIDADGTMSRFSGDPTYREVVDGDPLTAFPTGFSDEGLDWFTVGDCEWTFGDDLHVEDPASHPGALRNGIHDDGLDPLVLDWDNSLDTDPAVEQVDVDLETGTTFTGCAGVDPKIKFFDADLSGFWDDGEDLVLDINLDGIFNG